MFSTRLVLDALWNDEHLARRYMHRAVAKIDPESTLHDNKRFIRFRVIYQIKSPCNFTTLN